MTVFVLGALLNRCRSVQLDWSNLFLAASASMRGAISYAIVQSVTNGGTFLFTIICKSTWFATISGGTKKTLEEFSCKVLYSKANFFLVLLLSQGVRLNSII